MTAIEKHACSILCLITVLFTAHCGSDDTNGQGDDRDTADSTDGHHGSSDSGGDMNKDGGDTNSEVWPDDKYISIVSVHEKTLDKSTDMLLINVSDEEFYSMGHIENSLKIPWDTLSTQLDSVDAGRHIVLYCRRGVRSESAYDTLVANDYSMVWVMDGGLEEWIDMGYPVVHD
jgi:rhodanese-related sulfurtransferase